MVRCLILIMTLMLSQALFAQDWNLIYDKELEAEDYLLQKQYEKAAKKYEDALKLNKSSAYLKYKVGSTYLLTPHKKHLALSFLKDAAKEASPDFDPRAIRITSAPIDALYDLGRALQMNNMFTEAIDAFTKYKGFLTADDPKLAKVEQRIESCRIAPSLMAFEQGLEIQNLGNTINNKDENFNPVVSGDGNTLAFTRKGTRGYDVYVAKKKDGVWGRPRRITDDIRGGFLKTVSLSYDGTWMYLVDDFAKVMNIYDTFDDQGWVRTKKLRKPVTSKYNETHAVVSPDGKTMYFTSDRPDGLGGLDIYKSTLDNRERWGDPENLGSRVNTSVDEDTPFLTPDGRYLFFSSQGHNSMGGFDVFYIDLNGSGEPINLGYPINDAGDNLFFSPQSVNSGLMALSKEDGFGVQDIYEMKIIPMVTLNGNLAFAGNKSDLESDSVSVAIVNAQSDQIVTKINTSIAANTFSYRLKPGDYRIEAKGLGFEDFSTSLAVASNPVAQNIDITLIPLPVEVEPEPEPQLAELPDQEIKPEPEAISDDTKKQENNTELVSKPEVETAVKPDVKPDVEPEIELEPAPQPRSFVTETLPSDGYYSVQIMALLVPISVDYFENIDGVIVIKGDDGYHRYCVGAVNSKEEAKTIQQQLAKLGYTNSFIRFNKAVAAKAKVEKTITETSYTIQIMALKNPVDTKRFSNLPDVQVEQGDDSFYRYFTGNYTSYQQASTDLARLERLGYKGAFVRVNQ